MKRKDNAIVIGRTYGRKSNHLFVGTIPTVVNIYLWTTKLHVKTVRAFIFPTKHNDITIIKTACDTVTD